MKNRLFLILLLSFSCFSACKKEEEQLLIVNEDMEFVTVFDEGKPYIMGNYYRVVQLKPGDKAYILGGDMLFDGTYTINGATLAVKAMGKITKFKIISATALKEEGQEVIMKRVK